MAELELLCVVALLEDLPRKGLRRGQVGTIVEFLAEGVYEVEFTDDSGVAYASIPLHANQLLKLHHAPANRAA
ncbi:MAG: DUF4926 domain-containing protein [Bryobacteraceae bacterium]